MTRAELSAILSDLIRRHAITLDDARATLARFDAGSLTDLPLSATQQERDDNSWVIAVALLLFLLSGSTRRTLNAQERRRAQRLLRAQYESRVALLAASVASGGSVVTWQAGMQSAVAGYTRQMAVAGAGTLPRATVQATVDAQLQGQWVYLATFAVTILVGSITGSLMSEAAILSRSKSYGGHTGWGAFFVGQGNDAGYGYVDRWETHDDGRVCVNCSPRNGVYFLPSVGPFPGWDCLGTCRCRRIPEYNPSIYERLTGRRAA